MFDLFEFFPLKCLPQKPVPHAWIGCDLHPYRTVSASSFQNQWWMDQLKDMYMAVKTMITADVCNGLQANLDSVCERMLARTCQSPQIFNRTCSIACGAHDGISGCSVLTCFRFFRVSSGGLALSLLTSLEIWSFCCDLVLCWDCGLSRSRFCICFC